MNFTSRIILNEYVHSFNQNTAIFFFMMIVTSSELNTTSRGDVLKVMLSCWKFCLCECGVLRCGAFLCVMRQKSWKLKPNKYGKGIPSKTYLSARKYVAQLCAVGYDYPFIYLFVYVICASPSSTSCLHVFHNLRSCKLFLTIVDNKEKYCVNRVISFPFTEFSS